MTRDVRPQEAHGPVIRDPAMRAIYDNLGLIAPTALPVLVLGETGSGKEVVADWIHNQSGRQAKKLVKINCAGLTESVVESELFGHERGAFTGAAQCHEGLFEVADGGTLFLDEIAELPARTQAKLLRVLETGELLRVGSSRPRKVEVRIVAATHRDLLGWVERGEFRQDLYFRLNGLTVELPPLRERHCEIMPLASMFLERYASKVSRPDLRFDNDVAPVLMHYAWPGNIRELRHVVERSAAMCVSELVGRNDLAFGSPQRSRRTDVLASTSETVSVASGDIRGGMRSEVRDFEKTRILTALTRTSGNQTEAAKLLGVSRRTLSSKLKTLDIRRSSGHLAATAPELERTEYRSETEASHSTGVTRGAI